MSEITCDLRFAILKFLKRGMKILDDFTPQVTKISCYLADKHTFILKIEVCRYFTSV